jgi:hypothetical protein
VNVVKLSQPSRHSLQRAAQRWKQNSKPEYRGLIDAEIVKSERKAK